MSRFSNYKLNLILFDQFKLVVLESKNINWVEQRLAYLLVSPTLLNAIAAILSTPPKQVYNTFVEINPIRDFFYSFWDYIVKLLTPKNGISHHTITHHSSINGYIFTLFPFLSFFRVIQSSHPVCNTIMLFGVITCLVSVVLLGIDGRFVNPDTYPKVSIMIQLYLSHHHHLS